ncbi:hypothetical protein Tco_1467646 [Tanacetum coccineum]
MYLRGRRRDVPDKVDDVLSLPSPKYLKDVQKLKGKLASLNRFLAKSAEKSLPFFKTLKKCTKKGDFHWTEEADDAFKQMKQLIAELPTLTHRRKRRAQLYTLGDSHMKPRVVNVRDGYWKARTKTYKSEGRQRLRIEKEMGVKNLQENVDSRLVANQVNGTYIAKEADMIRCLEKADMIQDVLNQTSTQK